METGPGTGYALAHAPDRCRRALYPAAACELHAGRARGRSRVRGGPSRERFQARGRARGTRRPGVSLLWHGDQEADALHPGKSGADVRGGGDLAEPRGEGAGVPHRPGALRRVRRGLARVLPDAASADDDRHERSARPGLSRRGRSDGHDAEVSGSCRTLGRPSATGELLGGGRGRRSRLCRWSARQRLQDRHPAGGAGRPGVSVLWLRDQAADALRPGKSGAHVRGRRDVARSRRQSAGISHGPEQLLRLRRGLARVLSRAATAHDRRHDRASGQRHLGRDRSDRGTAVGPSAGDLGAGHPEAAGALHAGDAGR